MYIDINLQQGQQLSQQLNLAPQLLNWLRLLQCPTTDLTAMVARELESNPALESDGPVEAPTTLEQIVAAENHPEGTPARGNTELDQKIEFLSQVENEWRHEYQQFRSAVKSRNPEQEARHQFMMDSIAESCSLQQHLMKQVDALHVTEEDRLLVEFVVGSLDERGYLTTTIEEMSETTVTPRERIERALHAVQSMDPPGVGARDLAECLLLQMEPSHPRHDLAVTIVTEHLYLLANAAYEEIADATGVEPQAVHEASAYISSLDPNPGRLYQAEAVEYITPDINVQWDEDDGDYTIALNDTHIPRLRISATCKYLADQKNISAKDRSYIREKMRNASFLIQGISQRQETLYRVTEEILRVQRAWFDEEGELQPLTMAKVAGVLNVHETTVSRALANKYMRTPRGLFEMRHFFRSGYLCSDGTAVTPDTVKSYLKQMIGREDTAKPLTDLQLVEMLKERGLDLARRTVAKYRDEMGIAASKDRKSGGKRSRKLKIAPPAPAAPRVPSETIAEPALVA